jgi:hypothetical protein
MMAIRTPRPRGFRNYGLGPNLGPIPPANNPVGPRRPIHPATVTVPSSLPVNVGIVCTIPSGTIALADFAKDQYWFGSLPALLTEILVEDATNWGAWDSLSNIQPGTGLIYNQLTGGVPVFSPSLIGGMIDGFSIVLLGYMNVLPIVGVGTPAAVVGVRAAADPTGFEHFAGEWSIPGTSLQSADLIAESKDAFNGTIFSGSDTSHPTAEINDPFVVGVTLDPSGLITVCANGYNPLVTSGTAAVDPWTSIALYVTDNNLVNNSRVVIKQMAVYSPPLTDNDLNVEVQLATEYCV